MHWICLAYGRKVIAYLHLSCCLSSVRSSEILWSILSTGVLLLEEIINSCGEEGLRAIIDAARRRFMESKQQKSEGLKFWWRVSTAETDANSYWCATFKLYQIPFFLFFYMFLSIYWISRPFLCHVFLFFLSYYIIIIWGLMKKNVVSWCVCIKLPNVWIKLLAWLQYLVA